MQRWLFICFFALLAPMPAAISARAQTPVPKAIDTPVTFQLTVPATVIFYDTVLQPGSYTAMADLKKLVLFRDGRAVASAPVTWKQTKKADKKGGVVSFNTTVEEIHFPDSSRRIVIPESVRSLMYPQIFGTRPPTQKVETRKGRM
jgi:hypothetical protein